MWRCGDGGGECGHYEYFPTRRLGSQAPKRRLGSQASIGKTISGRSSCRKSTNSERRRVVDHDLDGAPSARSSSVGLTADLWRPPPDELTHLDEERPQGCEESEAVKDDHRDRGAGRGRLLVPGSRVVFGAGRLTILMGLICSNFGSRCRGTSLCHKPKSRPASRH